MKIPQKSYRYDSPKAHLQCIDRKASLTAEWLKRGTDAKRGKVRHPSRAVCVRSSKSKPGKPPSHWLRLAQIFSPTAIPRSMAMGLLFRLSARLVRAESVFFHASDYGKSVRKHPSFLFVLVLRCQFSEPVSDRFLRPSHLRRQPPSVKFQDCLGERFLPLWILQRHIHNLSPISLVYPPLSIVPRTTKKSSASFA
jgi:hypothetical protein